MTTKAYLGLGSSIAYSSDGVTFYRIAQLQRIEPQGSKMTTSEQTNVSTPDNFTRHFGTRVDSGEIDLAGVLDPENGSVIGLGSLHANLTLATFRITLTDGSPYTFQALVLEFVPFTIMNNKALAFKAKLKISGGITGPAGLI